MTGSKHFEGKDALKHVVEKKAQGILEAHGTELPGNLAAAIDAAKELSLLLLISDLLLSTLSTPQQHFLYLALLSLGMIVAKIARGAYLAWSRLERLHRIMEQERYEIEHHRGQEREELKMLYHAKGLEDPLLDQVIDVLMADGDRLLKIMLEEELGLTLQGYQHPLQVGLGAGLGALASSALCLAAFWISPSFGLPLIALLVMGVSGMLAARLQDNRALPALIWAVGIGALCYGVVYFTQAMLYA